LVDTFSHLQLIPSKGWKKYSDLNCDVSPFCFVTHTRTFCSSTSWFSVSSLVLWA
jgi:hypothetical protein